MPTMGSSTQTTFPTAVTGKIAGPDRRDVHPGPPQSIAVVGQAGIDQNLVVVEDQRRQIGEDQHRKKIGRQQLIEAVPGEPCDDDVERQKTPKQRRQSDEHGPSRAQSSSETSRPD